MSAKRSGKKDKGLTKNQKRKQAYATQAGFKHADAGSRKKKRSRLVGSKGPHVSCGNVACKKCFEHIEGKGTYPRK